ncbi:hypothetical protein HS088_TW15G00844 [Tripterygium wilfordii]|uniref:Prolamin-like domain-containing protein n=1 Tax=Tripterygium wilfordii TaxID=458696 RepID=A0A7J7CMM8_TRIWF|nr:egg cell-secreted protein 1.1-like [Tripterygium wilfordii]KAF5735342.1 hypothetical protein HS088_TW15G00844 [Tripterygium wilfordii]
MARPLLSSSSTLAARLKVDDDDESLNCWESLGELQACTGEILLFFLNGETYLGHGCCEAIHMIGHQCWPDLIDILGFTSEEGGDVLEGYCDASDHDNNTVTPSNAEAALITPTLVP